MGLDHKLQAELRAKYNPEGSELRNRQLRMLDMLIYIDSVCQNNNIKYWLSSGTCLGAVRHGGFIPWDDDVDIELLKDDYDRLIKILRENENDEFVVQTHHDDPNYIMDFGKLRDKTTKVNEVFGIDNLYKHQGLFVDIFCMSPSSSKMLHYFCGRLRVLEVYAKRWSMTHRFGKILFPLLRGTNNLILSILYPIDRIGAKKRLRHCLGVTFLASRNPEDLKNVIRVPFEGYLLPIPAGYDNYLKGMFGNYQELKITHSHISK